MQAEDNHPGLNATPPDQEGSFCAPVKMKRLPEKQGLNKLRQVKDAYRETVRAGYEHRAKNCLTCETKGACCLDAHFVNVHITRLEAAAIRGVLDGLPEEKRERVYRRVDETIEKYGLRAEGDTFARTFACPLFEKETGCLVHEMGKPLPCIQHACYERREDLPPDELLTEQEETVERLNRRVYGNNVWLPLPLWLGER
jgi:hypothetical protein